MSTLLNHCFQQKFHFDEEHGTGEPDLGFGDVWHNIIPELELNQLAATATQEKLILSISLYPC